MQMKMQKYGDQISEISKKAKMELNIENVTIFAFSSMKNSNYNK